MLGFTETGQVRVNGRHHRALVAQIDLNLAQVLALLQQMSGIGVTQGMDMGLLGDAAGLESQTEGALQGGAAHRFGRGAGAQSIVSLGRKKQGRMAVRFPLLAQEQQGAFGQRDVAILIAFAGADVQEHALGINVTDLKPKPFGQTQAARVNGDQTDPMVQGGNRGDNAAHFRGGEHDGEFELGIGASQFQFVGPGPLQGFLPKQLDGANGLGAGLPGYFLVGLEVNAILTDVFGRKQVGGLAVKLTELAETSVIGPFGAWADGQKLQVIGEGV